MTSMGLAAKKVSHVNTVKNMQNIILTIVFMSTYVAVLFGYLSDGVNQFDFRRSQDGSGEYDFEYKLENGDNFHGQTIGLNGSRTNVHIIFGYNNSIYWTEFYDDEWNSNSSSVIKKSVRRVERTNDGIFFKDDLVAYTFNISDSVLEVIPFLTEWDYDNICLTKSSSNNHLFEFEIRSKNNARHYEGTTYTVNKNPQVQRFDLKDKQLDATYEIDLTSDELETNKTFCKHLSRTNSELGVLGAYAEKTINSKLIKRLNT